jgi:hypothetical protein
MYTGDPEDPGVFTDTISKTKFPDIVLPTSDFV